MSIPQKPNAPTKPGFENIGVKSGNDAESRRLAALADFEIVGTERDERFDRITKLASRLLNVPVSLISLVDDKRQWFKSATGVDANETPREISFCQHTIQGDDLFEVEDALADARFQSNPLVTNDPNIRFYAGAPLVTGDGYRLGSICVIDQKPRKLTPDERAILVDLSRMVMDELELHRLLRRSEREKLFSLHKEIELRQILNNIAHYIAVLTPDGVISETNIYSLRHQSAPLDRTQNTLLWDSYWWSHSANVKRRLQRAVATAKTGTADRFDIAMRVDKKTFIMVDFMLTPACDENGKVEFLVATASDISERKSIEDKLAQSEARFRGTFDNAAVGIAHVSLDGRWLAVNQRLLDILGYTNEEMLTRTLPEIAHSDDLPGHLAQFGRLKSGEIDRYVREKRYMRKDGTPVWVNVTVSLQRSDMRVPLYAILIIEDITIRKEDEERKKLLLAELNHRTKNMMSMMQAIANSSLRYTREPETFIQSFQSRLQAMAYAHNLLTQESWQRASLKSLIESQLYVEVRDSQSNVALDGPDILLSGQIAINLALILHELTSNAVKYGALSVPEGKLYVHWDIEQNDDTQILVIKWRETNGPPAHEPRETGFGLNLIERSLKRALGAQVGFAWKTEGLEVDIRLPLTHFRENVFFKL